MGLFKKAGRIGGRVAKNAAKQIIMPEDEKAKQKAKDADGKAATPQHSDAEFDELQEKYNALMTEKWKAYYKQSCDGECETCEYYDWCPDDFDGVFPEDEVVNQQEAAQEPASAVKASGNDAEGGQAKVEEAEAEDEADEVEDEELTDEQRAAKAAAIDYYEDGCDGDCDNCEHYEWCPAEEENEDDEVLFRGITQGDVKNAAKDGVELARETAAAARDLKDALDDITGGLNLKELLK